MSVPVRTSIDAFRAMKARGEPIVMVTAYDFTSAEMADAAGLPVLLVGDSLGMVVYGHDSTLRVTLDDMIRHAAAVVRGSTQALVIADLPFLTYATLEQGVASAGRLIAEAGVQAVKLEGGSETVIATVRRLVELGIPVMGHLGYTPQSTLQIGIRLQAKSDEAANRLIAEATALQEAGAFGVVLELVPDDVAARATQSLTIPVIGIGAGPHCDGQVQVWHDILGLYGEHPPRHAKRFAALRGPITAALSSYADEVKGGVFPAERRPRQ